VKGIQVIGMARSASIVGLTLAAVLATFAASARPAHAVELYWDPATNTWVRSPVRVIASPIRNPTRYYVVPPANPRVHVHVRHVAPPPTTVVVDQGTERDTGDDDRDPYDTSSIVIAGGGVGGLFFFGDGLTSVAAAYKLHLGLAVGAAEFALRFDLVPDAGEVQTVDGPTPAALYTTGASFNYRFLERAVVHPVAGVGFEALYLDPHVGSTGTAFAVTGRAGLELAYPLADGALALGIDVTGHLPFAATDSYSGELVAMLGAGAYVDYRF
jgi:hypothetical protein